MAYASLLLRVQRHLAALPPAAKRPQGGGRKKMTKAERRKVWTHVAKRILYPAQVKMRGGPLNFRACAIFVFGKAKARAYEQRIKHEFNTLPP